MRKILLSFIVCLLAISCTKKDKGNQNTLSGLTPSNFEYKTEEGRLNKMFVMKNASGMEVAVINLGARIVSVMVPDKDGNMQNVVLGYENADPYMQLSDYTGAVLGRYAGRISGGEIAIDRVTYRLRTNENKTMLNGGPRGFSSQHFIIEQPNEHTLTCSYFSQAGEEGFPGTMSLTVTYTLTPDNALDIAYEAKVLDRATFINVSNQLQFNVGGKGSSENPLLYVDANSYIETNEDKIPTGKILPIAGTSFDFSSSRSIDINAPQEQNYVLNNTEIGNMAASLVSPSTGIKLDIYTTEPSIQLLVEKASVALKTQHYPDSPHQPDFPSTVLAKDSVFTSQTIYKFGIEK